MTASLISQTSPDVLANKGVQVEFVKTRPDSQGIWECHPGGERTTAWVKLTNWKMKELEDRFGSLSAWDQALTDRLFGTVIATLAVALGPEWPEQRVAEAMVPGNLKEYRLAIAATQAIAMGRDPKATFEAMIGTAGDPETTTGSGSSSSTPTAASAGPTSGPAGWDTATTGTSSGTSPSGSSSPSSSQWQ